MSEYQYYEFTALDRLLTREDMAQLRAVSSRAEITPTSFVNHYERGELNADPADWMRRWLDAYDYFANWCACQLSLRVPPGHLRRRGAGAFRRRVQAAHRSHGGALDRRLDAG